MQVAVEAKHSLIIATEITKTTSDLGALGTMALQAQEAWAGRNSALWPTKATTTGRRCCSATRSG